MPTSPRVPLPQEVAGVRGHHDGSWFYRRRERKWFAAVTMLDGRRVERACRWFDNSKPAAKELLKALLEERDAELVPSHKLTLAAWLYEWLGDVHVRPATLRYYKMIAEVHIIPAIGQIPLANLGPTAIERWLNGMEGSPRSIAHRYSVLRAALNKAVRHHKIIRNPILAVDVPSVPEKDVPILDAAQARTLIEGTTGDWYGALWAVLLGSGLRISEALGLTWDDFELTESELVAGRTRPVAGNQPRAERPTGSLFIRSQLARRNGTWVLAPTKAGRGSDRIALPEFAVVALRSHRAMMVAARTPDWTHFGHIFVTPAGAPPYAWHVTEALYAAEKALGLPRVGPHQLRHTNVTLMAEAGVPEDVRMQRVGHATRAMARHYTHGGEAQDRVAADALGRVIGGK